MIDRLRLIGIGIVGYTLCLALFTDGTGKCGPTTGHDRLGMVLVVVLLVSAGAALRGEQR